MPDLISELRHLVGAEHVLDSEQAQQRASHFWDSSPLQARALVKPASTDEVSAVLKACHNVCLLYTSDAADE